MTVVDIRSDLRMVFDSGPGQAYLLRHGTHAVLIDTGIAGQGDAIAGALAGWGLDREALTHVLLTHWHPDHVGSAAEIANWPNAQIWAHRIDAPIIRGDSYGTFPSLTRTEQQFYAQIAGTIPNAAPARVDRELGDDEHLQDLGPRASSTPQDTPTAALPFSSRRPASCSPATWPPNSRVRWSLAPSTTTAHGPAVVPQVRRHRGGHGLLRTWSAACG